MPPRSATPQRRAARPDVGAAPMPDAMLDETRLHTPRLLLDALRGEDAAALYRYRADPAVSRYQGWCPASLDEAQRFIVRCAAVTPDTPGSWFQRAIRQRDSGELIGDLGLHFVAEASATVELGISLAPAHQRQGLAAEALQAALRWIFEDLRKHRVIASVDPRNQPCMTLLAGIGMRREAHFVESLPDATGWADDVIFAMLEREWRGRHASERHRG